MNKEYLKLIVKEIVRECIMEVKKSKEGSIPKGSLAKLNPKIADSGKKGKMKLPPKGQSSTKLAPPVKEEESGESSDTCGGEGHNDSDTSKIIHVLSLLTQKLKRMNTKPNAIAEGGPQYKVVDGHSYVEQPGKTNRAREIQSDPKVNESNKAPKKITKENHKVQARSARTSKDLPNNPKNVRDPEVPQT